MGAQVLTWNGAGSWVDRAGNLVAPTVTGLTPSASLTPSATLTPAGA